MPSRFYAPLMSAGSESIDLPPDEAHHLAHVLRLRAGDEIAVFDGRGRERRARVEAVGRRRARVRLLDAIAPAPEPRVALTLAQAALKGDRMDAVVRDATMLGVAAVQPLLTRRTVVRAETVRGDRARERWRRVAIASAKQCRRAVVPEILPARGFDEWLATNLGGGSKDAWPNVYMLVEPVASAGAVPLSSLAARDIPFAATLVVGPEGGWDDGEMAIARDAGCTLLTIGSRTLRADAAALVAVAALGAVWRVL